MKNLLFIPCFNDIENCQKILKEIELNYNYNFDILIINDGSKKNVEFSTDKFDTKIINLKNNYGIGFGLKLAINYALKNDYKKLCRIDSDGEHDPKYIREFFLKLENSDLILGERRIDYKQNILKLFSKKIIVSIINRSFNLKLKDYNCGMMSMNIICMKSLKNENLINYPEPQIILNLCQKNFKFSTINIRQRERYYGISSINLFGGLDFFLVTLTFILNRILNKND